MRPGDTITAEVSYSKGLFTTTIEDVNTRQSYTSPPTGVPGAGTDSAEWIVESADYNCILALTPVSQVTFTGAIATINGATHTIAGWGADAYWLLMVDYNWGFNAESEVATPYTQTLAYAKADTSALGKSRRQLQCQLAQQRPVIGGKRNHLCTFHFTGSKNNGTGRAVFRSLPCARLGYEVCAFSGRKGSVITAF